ncbi:alpha/beta fold hydrolase [Streptacidiphilus sp. P02-A3a]|uniref:alpha/beta fold hydrolase n=1 Tax=Streptacidiphilus sp. P02-A3a TaxID=2704468 RepID=UPI0015FA41A5|nr:alpha/beta fold hydrolase [Streptacidiphilus sp. P02-A3a]QMU70903.1 alpha/beta fold hydrolase [Streptacidiphilus sp. P02-A3a]
MATIELPAGTLDYSDSGGDGPTVVLAHGPAVDGTLWRHVVAELQDQYRVVVPTLPFGSHLRPMRSGADLSPDGMARLLGDFLEALDLTGVTLVQNDAATGMLLAVSGTPAAGRIARLVLASIEAFDNFPPGLPGRAIWLAAKVPGGLAAAAQPLRFHPLRRLPLAYGLLSRRTVPREIADRWSWPLLHSAGAREDLRTYLRGARPDRLQRAAAEAGGFDRPVLVVWAARDRVMPPAHGRRLAALFPQGSYLEIPDSGTLIPEDQPNALSAAIDTFVSKG